MSVNLSINGSVYPFPETNDENWGARVTAWATTISQATLQKNGGSFVLTAEIDFGATYGAKIAYIKSRTANPASAGLVRAANNETIIAARNAANSADLTVKFNASNQLEVNGAVVGTTADVAVVQADLDAHEANTSNPHSVTKAQVGLSNADNTSDLAKPVSTATQTALDLKVNTADLTESVQDIVGALVQDSSTIDATYNDAGAIESLAVIPGGITITDLAGTLSIAKGGTGQTAKTDAFDALAPTTTKGDIIVSDGTDNIRFPAGANGTVISYDSTEASGLKAIAPLTNPMNTAGDIIYGGASGAATRLAGAAGVLHGAAGSAPSWSTIVDADVNASAAISGSKLQAAASGNAGAVSTSNQIFGGRKNGGNSKVRVRLSGNQSIPASTDTRINLSTEDFDTNSEYASSTFTPTRSGYYQVNANVRINSLASGKSFQIWLYKNGSTIVTRQRLTAPAAGDHSLFISDIVSMNGSTDTLQLYIRHDDTVSRDVESTGVDTNISITELF